MYYFLTDVETTQKRYIWDLGYMLLDSKLNIVKQDYIILAENAKYPLWSNDRESLWCSKSQWRKQQDCFKNPEYSKRKIKEVNEMLRGLIDDYDPAFVAYNAKFDFGSFQLSGLETGFSSQLCLLESAKTIYQKRKGFTSFCDKHNFKTPKGQNKITAEILARYLLDDPELVEDHTSYGDLQIERLIMKDIFKQKKKLLIKPL